MILWFTSQLRSCARATKPTIAVSGGADNPREATERTSNHTARRTGDLYCSQIVVLWEWGKMDRITFRWVLITACCDLVGRVGAWGGDGGLHRWVTCHWLTIPQKFAAGFYVCPWLRIEVLPTAFLPLTLIFEVWTWPQTLTFNPTRDIVMNHTQDKGQGQKSLASKVRVKQTDGRTNTRSDGRRRLRYLPC